jgi:spermidine synthase
MTPHVHPGTFPIPTGTIQFVPDPARPSGWFVMINGLESSYVDVDDPTWLEFEYIRWIGHVLETLAPSGDPLAVLHLGAGGATLPRYVAATHPGSRQRVMEIDPRLLELVSDAFDLTALPGVQLSAVDAAEGLRTERSASYDVVIRDAFSVEQVPTSLTTPEYLAQVARVLRPGGTYLANVPAGADLHPLRAEARLAGTRFPTVFALVDPGQLRHRRFGNAVLVATWGLLGRSDAQAELSRRLAADPAPARLWRDWS